MLPHLVQLARTKLRRKDELVILTATPGIRRLPWRFWYVEEPESLFFTPGGVSRYRKTDGNPEGEIPM